MIISLIGMSNCGKSFWSKKLEAEQGYTRLSCDDMITAQLTELLPEVNITNMDSFAAWMGMPYEFGYQEREAAYLSGETSALVQAIEQAKARENVIIDTTGSVIYLSGSSLRKLKGISTIVYLQTTEAQVDEMTEKFFTDPKPLVWGECFETGAGESHEESLRRCYPKLLAWRQEQYKALADVTIPYARCHHPDYSVQDLLHDVLQHKR